MHHLSRKSLVQFRRSYAIIIGINKYEKINASLSTPVPDATRLSEVLRDQQGFVEEDITLLTNPTRADIMALLGKLKQSKPAAEGAGEGGFDISQRDCLLFYYAGHGLAGDIDGDGPAGYLLPSDAEPETARLRNDSLIPMEEVFSALDALDCHHTLLILDCCFAGSFRRIARTRGNLSVGFRPMSQIRFERYKKNRAWQVLASAGPTEVAADWMSDRGDALALVDPQPGSFHSPFAKALIDALSGEGDTDVKPRGMNLGDGVITANELFLYLHNQVEELTRKHPDFKPQNPDLFPMGKHEGGQFIFCDPRHPENDPAFDRRKRQNPYKGLHLFQPWDRDWFFGRSEDVAALLKKLEALPRAVLLLSGASGTGKSSLVRAGLLPVYLEQGYECFVLRPGARPWMLEPLPLEPQQGPDQEPILPPSIPLADQEPRLFTGEKQILFIDQFEEFFTECTEAEQNELEDRLLDLVEKARTAANAKIIICMRSDFEWQLELTRLGAQLLAKDFLPYQFYRLAGLDLAQLREALLGPAILHAYEFEKRGEESLVDRILQDIEYAPSALPLLSFTMSELFRLSEEVRKESGEDERLFTFRIYEDEDKLGGVSGALRGKLQQVYAELPDDEHRRAMEQVMLRMVRLNDGAYSRRRLYRPAGQDELHFGDPAKNARVKTVLRALTDSQLLIRGGGREEAPYIELIHDSLINTRPTFEWIKAFGGDTLLLQRQLWQAVVDSQRPQDKGRSLLSGYGASEDKQKKDESLTSAFSKLWDNNPKLLQVLEQVAEAASPYLLSKNDAILEAALPHIAPEDQEKFKAFWEDCHQKEQIPDLNALILFGYSDKLLDILLDKGDHWLNQDEEEFVRQSWAKRIEDILELKRQRDEAIALEAIATREKNKAQKLAEFFKEKNRDNYARALFMLDQYNAVAAEESSNQFLLLEKAEVLANLGELEGARAIYDQLIEGSAAEEKPRYYLKRAEFFLNTDRIDPAMDDCMAWINSGTLEKVNLTGIAVTVLQKTQQKSRTDQLLRKVIENTSDPAEKANYFHHLARYYEAADRREDALQALDQAISVEPNDPSYLAVKAAFLAESDQPDAAGALFNQYASFCGFLDEHKKAITPFSRNPELQFQLWENLKGVAVSDDRAITYFRRIKSGYFTMGNGKTTKEFITWNSRFISANTSLSASSVNVASAVMDNAGNFDAINTWDNSFLSFGMGQWSLGATNSQGELPALLKRINTVNPQVFQRYFGKYGLDISPNTGETLGFLQLEGKEVKAHSDKEQFRQPLWAFIFWKAAQDPVIKAIQLDYFMDRLKFFYWKKSDQLQGYSLSDIVCSEFGVALVLDHHFNRPGHVLACIGAAIQKIGVTNPADWTTDDERSLLETYLHIRKAYSNAPMTSAEQRADRIKKQVILGLLSEERGSYYYKNVTARE